ncbi:MAG TPA: glycosyltransferase family 2 protein [Pirellulales bacterium]|nr:glycosyltransferase family 2 protein [Pirellulales bacterium]
MSQTAEHSRQVVRRCPRLSVVFSFWNEIEVLPELVARTRRVLEAEVLAGHLSSYELVFVNDASTDGSDALLCRLAQGRDDIRMITTTRRFGVTPCVLAGMEYTTGDCVVYMDADLQDPPELIPKLLETWRAQPKVDVVHTVRESREGESRIKLLITQIGYRILRSTSSVDLPIEAGDFKLLSRCVVDQLVNFRENRPYMRGLVGWVGYESAAVTYRRDSRFSGTTKFPVFSRKVISNFFNSALISFSDAPLKATIVAGFACWVASLFYMAWIILQKLLGNTLPGHAATMVAILFMGGMNMLSVGVLGLYVNSIFLESKKRPNYIVRELFGFPGSVPVEKHPAVEFRFPAANHGNGDAGATASCDYQTADPSEHA